MATKDLVLELLKRKTDAYISGAEIAQRLMISRTAVWKAVSQLKDEGYSIDSVTNRGYRLSSCSDVLDSENLYRYLQPGIQATVLPVTDSTNTQLKALAERGAVEGTAVIAGEQTAGRGRMGRSFYSPSGSGIYMSILLRPKMSASRALSMTACAAVAVAETVEEISGKRAGIKWVNDVIVEGKKVCGILTEASMDCESGGLNYAIVGIGINLCPPENDFPEDIRSVAGGVFDQYGLVADLRSRVAAGVLNRFMAYYSRLEENTFYQGYVSRSIVNGQNIKLLRAGQEDEYGYVEEIAEDYALVVRMPDGILRRVSSGEVSIRPAEDNAWKTK